MPSNRKCNVSFRVMLGMYVCMECERGNRDDRCVCIYVYKCFGSDCPKRQGFEQFSRVLEMDLVQILSLKWRFPTSIYNT